MIQKEKLTKIVGAGNVSDDQAVLEEYSSDVSFVNRIRPVCVVKPADAKQIQKLVNLANETQTPLVPVSSGPPHFRGDTVPGIGGAVVVDLSRMKKIISVDRPRRVAMVEPGVTFGELIPAAAKAGIRLIKDHRRQFTGERTGDYAKVPVGYLGSACMRRGHLRLR
ncbi:FAD-binding oxidoreductase [Chloroflexota bacterium]